MSRRTPKAAVRDVVLASYDRQPAATQIRRSGRFHHRGLRGRLVKCGHIAVGAFILRYCGRRLPGIEFRAGLKRTPNAPVSGEPARCDRLTVRYHRSRDADDAYELSEQDVGCTTAREIARRWHHSCKATAAPGRVCSPGRLADCRPITSGLWRSLAGVRCTVDKTPGAAVELEYHESCAPAPPKDMFSDPIAIWAINLDCATVSTFPFAGLETGEPDSPCENSYGVYHRLTCAPYAGYACWVRFVASEASGRYGRCRSLAEPWRAFSFSESYGI